MILEPIAIVVLRQITQKGKGLIAKTVEHEASLGGN
jgi:hypothetical protein